MCESVESLIEVINDNIKSKFRHISTEIEEISNIKDLKNSKSINELENLNDNLTLTLKTTRRLKLLRNKFNRMKSEIDELIMYAYKPERIDTDDEEKWEEEENQIIKSKIKIGRPFKLKFDGKSESESESESECENKNV